MSAVKLAASNIGWAPADDGRALALMADLGFKGLEIAPTRVFEDDPYARRDDFAAWTQGIKADFGLAVSSMQSIWRGRSESIFDEDGARELLAHTARACDFAQAGKVANLVFGCPRNRNIPSGHNPREAVPFLIECGKLAAGSHTVFALEANPPLYNTNFLNSTAEVLAFLKSLDQTEGLGINLDIGAMIAMNENADMAARALPFVSHVHISEPGLVPIKPRSLHTELRALLEDSDYDGFVSLEMGSADFDTVAACLTYMADTFLG